MIEAMPRERWPNLHKETTRHGKTVWYVRIDRGKRIRLHATYGTPEFREQYDAAIAGREIAKPGKAANGTLCWLIDRYRESDAWRSLSDATRRQRENIFKQIIATAGTKPYSRVDRSAVIKGRDRRSSTPNQARHFVDTLRGLFRYAVDADLVKIDPTQGVATQKPKTKGFPVWTEDEIERFEKRWPRGTRERVMLDIFLYTGLRRGDAAKLGRQHVKNGVITLDTEKTGTRVVIPVLSELAETLKAGPTGDLAFIARADGRPLSKESLGNMFRDACREAGINKSAHGLRKAAATRAANHGATVAQLEAIFGWEGGRMASLYTRSADRMRLAAEAMTKLKPSRKRVRERRKIAK